LDPGAEVIPRIQNARRLLAVGAVALLGGFLVVVAAGLFYRFQSDRRIHDHRASVRDAGYPASVEELMAQYPPPEGESRADWLLRAHDAYVDSEGDLTDELFVGGLAEDIHWSEPIPNFMVEAMRTFVAQNAETLDLLRQSMTYPGTYFPLQLHPNGNSNVDHLKKLRELGYVSSNAAMLAAVDGDAKATTDALVVLFGLPESTRDEPLVITQVSRGMLIGMAIFALEQCVNRIELSDAQLAGVAAALERSMVTDAVANALVGERAILFDQSENKLNLWFHFRMNPLYSKDESIYDLQIHATNFVYNSSGLRLGDTVLSLDYLERLIAAADLPPEERQAAASRLESLGWQIPDRYPRARASTVAYASIIEGNLREIAWLRVGQLGLAALRYEAQHEVFPESADSLVPEYLGAIPIDPFGGEPIRYRRTDDGFVAYSLSRDLVDDHGVEREDGQIWRKGDISFTVERGD
jgi:hypothetical protein